MQQKQETNASSLNAKMKAKGLNVKGRKTANYADEILIGALRSSINPKAAKQLARSVTDMSLR